MYYAPGTDAPAGPPPALSTAQKVAQAWNSVQNFFGSWGRGTYAQFATMQQSAHNVRS